MDFLVLRDVPSLLPVIHFCYKLNRVTFDIALRKVSKENSIRGAHNHENKRFVITRVKV